MFFNKRYGLETLRDSLKGIEGVSVLPWKVYRKPSDYKPRDFFGASRVLLRSNLDGSFDSSTWCFLPRTEAYTRVGSKVAKLFKDWNKIRDIGKVGVNLPKSQLDSLHVIAHRVAPRSAYKLNVRLSQTEYGVKALVNRLSASDKRWRKVPMLPEELETLGSHHYFLREVGEKRASKIIAQLKAAHAAISAHLTAQGVDLSKVDFEVSASIKKTSPTHLEFYDLLLKPRKTEESK